jgi:kynurenine formamidase
MEIIDLSAPITASPEGTPDVLRTGIEFQDHRQGAKVIEELFEVGPELLRDGEGWANEFFTRFGTHNSTHVDAPWHYNSTIDGKPAETIEKLPLDWFVRPGVKLDFTGREDGQAIEAGDLERAVTGAGRELEPLDIVLVHTGCDRWIDDPSYMAHGPGVTAEATRWLFEKGIRVMGIDAWGWDRPLWLQAEEAREKGRAGVFWEAHQAGLAYCQIERMINLDSLPPDGFTISCLPLRLVGGSAAPARVVATLDQV